MNKKTNRKNSKKNINEQCIKSKSAIKNKKNISIVAPLQKVIDAIAQPLKSLGRRHNRKDDVDVPFAESSSMTELTTSMKFFYSNDKHIDSFDDNHLYEQICKDYPALCHTYTNLQQKRNSILNILANEEYMKSLDDIYGMNAFDVICLLFRICPSLFKGIFVKKVQNVIKNTQYSKKLKKHDYKIAKIDKKMSKRAYRKK